MVAYSEGESLASGRYVIRGVLGRGTLGVVYDARERRSDRPVALKTLHVSSPAALYDLKREFRSLAAMHHRNLVELYELVVDDGAAFFTMERLDGVALLDDLADVTDRLAKVADRFLQLAAGIAALHHEGKLHRDLKPSNVMVTDGRVVILDFGFVLTGDAAGGGRSLAGTLPYMAPEALAGGAGEATDWYAFGVLLYEALVGRRPIDGPLHEVALRKRRHDFVRPRRLDPTVPPELDDLAVALLAADPARRPDSREIHARLSRFVAVAPPFAASPVRPFVGRGDELARLHAALARVGDGEPALVLLEGGSGIGKTTLGERFLTEAKARPVWVLRSRCHPSERVAYRALDGLVDGLTRILREEDARRYLPAQPAPELLRLFPVLGGIPACAHWPEAPPVDVDEDLAVRRRAIAALRELLTRLALVRPLILWIDDLQWGERDSAVLLRELLRGPDAPPLLLVLAFRGEDRRASPCLQILDAALADPTAGLPRAVTTLALGGLSLAEARVLDAELRAHADAPDWLAAAHAEVRGNPFLLGELSRLVHRRPHAEPPPTAASAVIAARLAPLSTAARELLEVVALAGRPLSRGLLLDIVGRDSPAAATVSTLQKLSLLRPASGAEDDAVETYHDRIREALLLDLAAPQRRDLHRRIADVLLRVPETDPTLVIDHLCGAGDEARAAPFALQAAERAAAALAFERAAELYRLTRELGGAGHPEWRLQVREAESLANAGHGMRAGRAYADAIAELARAGDSPELRRLRLRAAEQFLHSGHLVDGMDMLRAILREVGVALPSSPAAALRESLPRRLLLLVGGVRYRLRDVPAPAPTQARLDVVWAATTSLSMINHAVSDALGVLHLVEALRLGERSRIVRALGFEAAWEAAIGGRWLRARGRRLAADALRLADSSPEPYDRGWAHMSAGATAWFCADWTAAVDHCERAERIYRERCTGTRWELAVTGVYRFSALAHLGRLAELERELPAAIRDAEERGDLFAANNNRQGAHALVWLAADAPELALHHAAQALATWPQDHFSSQHYYHLLSRAAAELYRGEPLAAWHAIESAWPRLRAAQFLRIRYIGAELRFLRARAALALLAPARRSARRPGEGALRRAVAEAIEKLADDDLPVHVPFAAALRAGQALLARGPVAARLALARALAGFDRAGMPLHREATRLRLGQLDRDAKAVARAGDWLTAAGVRRPERLAAMLLPGPV